MKKSLLFVVVMYAALGCSGGSSLSKTDEATVRQQFEKKSFDISEVPVNERARVQGFIDAQQRMIAQGKTPGVGR